MKAKASSKSMSSQKFFLVWRWILKSDPEAALDMFIQLGPIFPPSAALPLIHSQAPNLCASYLESSLEAATASHEDYDQELAGIYLRYALDDPSTEGDISHGTHLDKGSSHQESEDEKTLNKGISQVAANSLTGPQALQKLENLVSFTTSLSFDSMYTIVQYLFLLSVLVFRLYKGFGQETKLMCA